MLDLGDLSGGQEQIDTAFGVTPEQIRQEQCLLNTSSKLHYKGYEAKLEIPSGGFPEMHLRLTGDHKCVEDKAFVKKCYDILVPLVDEWNCESRAKLIKEREELVKIIK